MHAVVLSISHAIIPAIKIVRYECMIILHTYIIIGVAVTRGNVAGGVVGGIVVMLLIILGAIVMLVVFRRMGKSELT